MSSPNTPTPPPSFETLASLIEDDQPVDALGQPAAPGDDLSADAALRRRAGRRRATAASAGVVALVLGLTALFLRGDVRATAAPDAVADSSETALVPTAPEDPFTFSGLDIHPDRLHRAYFAGAFAGPAGADDSPGGADFRWRLDMYRLAYGEDDNMTIRVLDERTGRTLEVHELTELRERVDRDRSAGMTINWDDVNRERVTATTALRAKWFALGIPRDQIVIRWGYRDQTHEARARERRFLPYEVNLARKLGLSLLATEIGTVETFNQDHLVSSAGARSRYQMMPDVLARFGLRSYTLGTTGGATVQVREERHTLLAMEPSLLFVRGYANAVGHELPGLSAYHAGPGNIFHLYRAYLRTHPGLVRAGGRHVSDAYMWGVTDGFAQVSATSSFKQHSRAYVLKAYGSLRATENEVVDPAEAMRAEQVRLRPGASTTLAEVLAALDTRGSSLDWGPVAGPTTYERFRDLNGHIALPFGGAGVPPAGNLRLTTGTAGPVRFFLPLGGVEALRAAGLDVAVLDQTFTLGTYLVDDGERTRLDREYAELVEDAGRFGFTRTNAARLERIADDLAEAARRAPDSRFRQSQAQVARIHRQVWNTRGFRDLVTATEALYATHPRSRVADFLAGR